MSNNGLKATISQLQMLYGEYSTSLFMNIFPILFTSKSTFLTILWWPLTPTKILIPFFNVVWVSALHWLLFLRQMQRVVPLGKRFKNTHIKNSLSILSTMKMIGGGLYERKAWLWAECISSCQQLAINFTSGPCWLLWKAQSHLLIFEFHLCASHKVGWFLIAACNIKNHVDYD